jgi:hypothetical protein
MNRVLLKLALTRRKRPSPPSSSRRRASKRSGTCSSSTKTLLPTRLVFIAEAGSHVAMTREYARAPRGERAHGAVPRNTGAVTTMIGALFVARALAGRSRAGLP